MVSSICNEKLHPVFQIWTTNGEFARRDSFLRISVVMPGWKIVDPARIAQLDFLTKSLRSFAYKRLASPGLDPVDVAPEQGGGWIERVERAQGKGIVAWIEQLVTFTGIVILDARAMFVHDEPLDAFLEAPHLQDAAEMRPRVRHDACPLVTVEVREHGKMLAAAPAPLALSHRVVTRNGESFGP